MTLRDVRDRINEAIEEGFGSHEIVDGFSIFDHFKDDCSITYEQAISKLKYLKACAEEVDKYEDDFFSSYRQVAESNKREIVDILLALDFGEEESK